MNFSKNIILFICGVEIFLMGPRTISFILIDLLPIRVFSIPLISFSFILTIIGYLLIELFANRKILRRILGFRLIIFIWSCIIVSSSCINPIRDVWFESQGVLIFMMNVVTFFVASIYIGQHVNRLIFGMFITIGGTLFTISYFLFTDPTLLPIGPSSGSGRFEGLFTSSSIMALVAISAAFVFLYKSRIVKLIGIVGILIALSSLILSATRSTLIASCITLFVVLYYRFKFGNLIFEIKNLVIGVLLTFFFILYIVYLFPQIFENIKYTISRITELTDGTSDSGHARMAEFNKEIELFKSSPILGQGYGIINMYSIPGYGNHLFGHNFFSSLLARTGLVGFSLIICYGFYLFSKIRVNNKIRFPDLIIIAKAGLVGAIVLTSVSNFSGYQTFGIYGALVGIGFGVNRK